MFPIIQKQIKVENTTGAPCSGCLNVNRRLSPLDENIELFYLLLGPEFSAEDESKLFDVHLCWECRGILDKVHKYQVRFQNAQMVLQKTARTFDINKEPSTLSNFTIQKLNTQENSPTEDDKESKLLDNIIENLEYEGKSEILENEHDIEGFDDFDQGFQDHSPEIKLTKTEIKLENVDNQSNDSNANKSPSPSPLTKNSTKKQLYYPYDKNDFKNIKPIKFSLEDNADHYIKIKLTRTEYQKLVKRDMKSQVYTSKPYKCKECVIGFEFEHDYSEHIMQIHDRHLFKLRTAAIKRGTMLQFLTQNFSRNSRNTTKYDFKANTISWRVEWLFPNAEPNPVKFVDEKCHEKVRLSDLLDKYLNPDAEPFEGSKALMFYKAAGFNGVKVLLKAEKVKGSSKKYFELDTSESLMENLSGKCVVEFPIIVVVLKDHAYNFNIVTPEDEFFTTTEQKESTNQVISDEPVKNETTQNGQMNQANVSYQNTGINNQNTGIHNHNTGINNQNTGTNNQNTGINNQNTGTYNRYPKRTYRERQKRLLTEKVANDKQKVIENEIKAAKKRKPKNLLFTTGYSSEESVEISDDDSEVKLGENKT